MKTLAQEFNSIAKVLMPHVKELQNLDETINTTNMIDDIMFHKSEYIGGMAIVIIELVIRNRKGLPKV